MPEQPHAVVDLAQLRDLGGAGGRLVLNLVYNPQGPSLPPTQDGLEQDYKRELGEKFGVRFNRLFTLANMPIQRFGSTLISKSTFETYMTVLKDAHRDENLDGVMCRDQLSIDWQGYVYDCDFNQQLGLPVQAGGQRRLHVSEVVAETLQDRPIRVADHCFGCTAGL